MVQRPNLWIGTSWKMNKMLAQAQEFATALATAEESCDSRIQRFVIPSYTTMRQVKKILRDTSVKVGAQNMHWADAGAWTGDRVCAGVTHGTYDRAILVCGTGIGVCMAANKVPGIRAALTHDAYSAGKAATSNNAHVITLGARVVGVELAKTIADAWLTKEFDANGPSAENVEAINQVDQKYHRS